MEHFELCRYLKVSNVLPWKVSSGNQPKFQGRLGWSRPFDEAFRMGPKF